MELSHSRIDLYNTCPLKYKYHYIDKLRSKTLSSALFFGNYIGETVQMLCLNKKEELTDDELSIVGCDPYEFFDQLMTTVEINKKTFDLPTCPNIRYYKGDWDQDCLTDSDLNLIDLYAQDNGFTDGEHVAIHFDDLYPRYKNHDLDDDEYSYMNFLFYLSIRRKGHLMIKEYQNKILPKIVKVHSIEKKINIGESSGDHSIIGYMDLVADFQLSPDDELYDQFGDNPVTAVADHKTSSTKYKREKIEDSQQLSLYDYAEEVGVVCYLVMIKKIKHPKRGPRKGETHAEVQMMFHQIPEAVKEKHLEVAAQTLELVESEEFEPNINGCYAFHIQCPYYNLCNGGSSDGLVNLKR